MPWELKITHIDLIAEGDSTLIIATERDGTGAVVQRRSALIDGGYLNAAGDVHHVVTTGPDALAALDVMIATHYDEDHYNGLRGLLRNGSTVYDDTHIYDQGRPGQVTWSSKRQRVAPRAPAVVVTTPTFSDQDAQYTDYENAIAFRGHRVRVTGNVLSNAGPPQAANGWEGPSWLVGREVLWGTAVASAGAPRLTCVAANQYVLTAGGIVRAQSGVLNADRQKNAKSLAFLLTFDRFAYYVGGDLEAVQEDALRAQLVAAAPAGIVHVMKTSHHGSDYSSSNAFITALDPSAAIVSCGSANQHGHPHQRVVTALEATTANYFLTGESLDVNTPTLTAKAVVAGVIVPALPTATVQTSTVHASGDIIVRVSAVQAAANPVRFNVHCVHPDAGTNVAKNHAFAYTPFNGYRYEF